MPDARRHLKRAEENEKLADAMPQRDGFSTDWAITVRFYSSLHYIDAFLAGKQVHPLDHDARDSEVERNGSLTDIYKEYRRLKDWSRAARYDIAEYPASKARESRSKLNAIKIHILERLR